MLILGQLLVRNHTSYHHLMSDNHMFSLFFSVYRGLRVWHTKKVYPMCEPKIIYISSYEFL